MQSLAYEKQIVHLQQALEGKTKSAKEAEALRDQHRKEIEDLSQELTETQRKAEADLRALTEKSEELETLMHQKEDNGEEALRERCEQLERELTVLETESNRFKRVEKEREQLQQQLVSWLSKAQGMISDQEIKTHSVLSFVICQNNCQIS